MTNEAVYEAALRTIAHMRNLIKARKTNEYDTGFALGVELCSDIADQALECGADVEPAKEAK